MEPFTESGEDNETAHARSKPKTKNLRKSGHLFGGAIPEHSKEYNDVANEPNESERLVDALGLSSVASCGVSAAPAVGA